METYCREELSYVSTIFNIYTLHENYMLVMVFYILEQTITAGGGLKKNSCSIHVNTARSQGYELGDLVRALGMKTIGRPREHDPSTVACQ